MTLDPAPLSSHLGFLALVFYCLSLLPTLLRILFPQTKQTGIPQWLMSQRRLSGILAFLFAVGHGILLLKKRNLDFGDATTSWIYVQGIGTFLIFVVLTITSNDWSTKKLKKNWRRLHQLTYPAMFLLTWHVLDKMMGHWTYLTPICVVMIVTINGLFIWRRWIESRPPAKKAPAKSAPAKQLTKV